MSFRSGGVVTLAGFHWYWIRIRVNGLPGGGSPHTGLLLNVWPVLGEISNGLPNEFIIAGNTYVGQFYLDITLDYARAVKPIEMRSVESPSTNFQAPPVAFYHNAFVLQNGSYEVLKSDHRATLNHKLPTDSSQNPTSKYLLQAQQNSKPQGSTLPKRVPR